MARMARVIVAFYLHHVTLEKGVVALKQSLNRSDDYSARACGSALD